MSGLARTQPSAATRSTLAGVPHILRAPSRAVDAASPAQPEVPFGHDFAAVRVHAGSIAGVLQRKDAPPVRDAGVGQPSSPPGSGRGNRANTPLAENDRKRLAGLKNLAGASSAFAVTQGLRFVVHDTAARADKPATQAQAYGKSAQEARGQLGEGPAAYVPTEGEAVVARPTFFDPRRPTTTEYERRRDIAGVEQREQAFQRIWKAAKPAEQEAALSRAFTGLELSPTKGETEAQQKQRAVREELIAPAEIETEKKAARSQLTSPLPPRKDPKRERTDPAIRTTAAWAVGEICARLAATPAAEVASSKQAAADLTAGCSELGRYFAERVPRMAPTVNVEIAQRAASQCRTSPTEPPGTAKNPVPLEPLPTPAYTDSQYQGVAGVYLQSALQAGRFPEIVTHFWVDRGLPGAHCDPRCFDLQHLYDVIADAFGHERGSSYGELPRYGTKDGVHNVWWHGDVCGGPPPGASK